MDLHELNLFYKKLEERKKAVTAALRVSGAGVKFTAGYFGGNYTKSEDGGYAMDYYPIPVISVTGLCDIEVNPGSFSVSTKLTRDTALAFDYGRLEGTRFEVYGVDDYLCDYYAEGDTPGTLRENILKSAEENIGFSFYFSDDTAPESLVSFVLSLPGMGFFY